MSTFEDGLRVALRDLADEVDDGRVLRWAAPPPLRRRRLRRPLAVGSGLVAAGLAALAAVLLPLGVATHQPVRQPPELLRLSELTSARPGAADLAVTVAAPGHELRNPTYLLRAGSSRTVRLAPSVSIAATWWQELSPDGTRFVREGDDNHDPRLELVDLRTGRTDDLGGATGACPSISPDDTTVAFFAGSRLRLLDVRTRSWTSPLRGLGAQAGDNCAAALGWSPDGTLLAVHRSTGTVVIDPAGRVVRRVTGTMTNGSMSWSPDGQRLLLYQSAAGRFVVLDLAGGSTTVLTGPRDATAPLGWAGGRVVWMAGAVGAQRLVTTDDGGADERLWLRFAAGSGAVESVQWSQALSGAAVG